MRHAAWCLVLLAPGLALAEHGGKVGTVEPASRATPVIGGTNALQGKWPDVAAVNIQNTQACTGTLIAPTVVITAGHCVTPPPTPNSVLLGTASLDRPADGETIPVKMSIEYPNSQTSEDVGILILTRAATETPRPIASGWARLEITNAAAVQFVGYGAIDMAGNTYIPQLQEATSTITDFDCTTSSGCNAAAKPNGELGAGGMGIDTCPGDSGGPMYLTTSFGTFLAGVTSRSYDNARFACSEGGIYERPDKIVDWIDQVTGVKVARAPEPTADPIDVVRGDGAESMITANDPKSDAHTFAIATPPAHGSAVVRADGRVRVCTDPSVAGTDKVVVTVTDKADANRHVDVTIPIMIEDAAPGSNCDVNAFGGSAGGGCCDSGRGAGGAIPLSIVVLMVLRRRR
ncbi:MAG: Peptidase and chymotrypsin/Hap [Myxococcales bacterium]|nr:Peptidase and chymotrypsin/Hap [Myxococcales bacterium]